MEGAPRGLELQAAGSGVVRVEVDKLERSLSGAGSAGASPGAAAASAAASAAAAHHAPPHAALPHPSAPAAAGYAPYGVHATAATAGAPWNGHAPVQLPSHGADDSPFEGDSPQDHGKGGGGGKSFVKRVGTFAAVGGMNITIQDLTYTGAQRAGY